MINIIALLKPVVNWTVLPKPKICLGFADLNDYEEGSYVEKYITLGVRKFGQPGEGGEEMTDLEKRLTYLKNIFQKKLCFYFLRESQKKILERKRYRMKKPLQYLNIRYQKLKSDRFYFENSISYSPILLSFASNKEKEFNAVNKSFVALSGKERPQLGHMTILGCLVPSFISKVALQAQVILTIIYDSPFFRTRTWQCPVSTV